MNVRPLERGQSMAWTAILFSTVLVPLFIFVTYAARAWQVRNLLQEATDAGCQAAADAAANIEAYRNSGEVRFYNTGNAAWDIGLRVFNKIVADKCEVGPSKAFFQIVSTPNQEHVHCMGKTWVNTPLGRKWINTESFSAIKYSR